MAVHVRCGGVGWATQTGALFSPHPQVHGSFGEPPCGEANPSLGVLERVTGQEETELGTLWTQKGVTGG